jgi:hypothetical protein
MSNKPAIKSSKSTSSSKTSKAPSLPTAKETAAEAPTKEGFVKLSPSERKALSKEELRAYYREYNAYRRENGLIKPRVEVDQVARAFNRVNRAHKFISRLGTLFSMSSEIELERELAAAITSSIHSLAIVRNDINDLPPNWKSKAIKAAPARMEPGAVVALREKNAEQFVAIFPKGTELLVNKVTGKYVVCAPVNGDGPQLAIEAHKLTVVRGAAHQAE